MDILYGKPLAEIMLNKIKSNIELYLNKTPVLGVICDDETNPYFKGIMKDAEFCGISVLAARKRILDGEADGIISLVNEIEVPLYMNMDGGYTVPCTAEATMKLLRFYRIPIQGRDVCIVGRSERVGKPLINLMLSENATVTICHSKTRNIADHMKHSNIIVTAAGNAGFNENYITNRRTVLVDIGGDFQDISRINCTALAPSIGGVGPVTRAVLMEHLYSKVYNKEKYYGLV